MSSLHIPSRQHYAILSSEAVHVPEGLPQRFRSSLRNAFLSTLAPLLRPSSKPSLSCLYCHYVFDDQVRAFEQLLKTLQSLATFVDSDTCFALLAGRKPLDRHYLHLSFDDGFKNLLSNAAPVLARLGIPGTAFVPTAILDADYDTVARYCLQITRYAAPIEMLSWSDVRELSSMGFAIGSHTRSHARLSELSTEEQFREEVMFSKTDIEQKLGMECPYIAWPYGTRGDTSTRSLEYIQQCGYSACFGAFRGRVLPGITNRYAIPRHHFEADWPLNHVTYFLARNSRERTITYENCK
jgi:peptidoglycan/xylan/chitin deacetylase (PgdA/CDA1 family)